jgi:hypothetical protein
MNVPLLSPGQAMGLDVLMLLSALVSGSLLIGAMMRTGIAKRSVPVAVRVRGRGRIAGRQRR